MTKPISPKDIAVEKERFIPDEVLESFNELISTKFSDNHAEFTQDSVIDLILSKLPNEDRSTIFSKGWLNIEEIYRASGWQVSYTKPSYNQSFRAYFEFWEG